MHFLVVNFNYHLLPDNRIIKRFNFACHNSQVHLPTISTITCKNTINLLEFAVLWHKMLLRRHHRILCILWFWIIRILFFNFLFNWLSKLTVCENWVLYNYYLAFSDLVFWTNYWCPWGRIRWVVGLITLS